MMSKRVFLLVVFFLFIATGGARAQGICPLNGTSSNALVCVFPQVFGGGGLSSGGANSVLLPDRHEAHFEADFVSSFQPITEAVGIQVSQLPLASPSSGINFVFDAQLKTFVPSTEETLGPIIGERAGTIGRNKLYVAFSYQYFNFNSIDGINTAKIPAIFAHAPFPPIVPSIGADFDACSNQTGLTGARAGDPCFVRDFINTSNNIDLRVHQYTIYATYGITKRLDVSVAVPLLDVRMNVTTNATIVQNGFALASRNLPGDAFHQFNPPIVLSCGAALPCFNGTFSDSGSAAGIGDVVLRGKYELYKGEKVGFAIGADARVPSGDAKNFLGSGSLGVRPFGVISYSARVSPHAEIGYEKNGNSILAGNFIGPAATNTKGSMPDRFTYILGADVSIVKRLTGAFDFYGQRLFGVPQLVSSTFTDFGHCSDVACDVFTPGTAHPNVAVKTGVDYNILNAAVGLKYRAFGRLVLSGNVLIKLNDSGLRSDVVPLVGASYSF
jgi:hypothetical protein